jgi:toxin ParE1/3/4
VGVKLRYTRAALHDIGSIRNYIAVENPAAAERVRLSILRTIDVLTEFPFLGRPGRRKGTREKPVPKLPYLVLYRTGEDELVILRVYHGAQSRRRGGR